MSASSERSGKPRSGSTAGGFFDRLPDWLAPRSEERRGRGELRLVESFLLIIIALVLAVATVNDLVREVKVGKRLTADLKGWEHYTGHYYHNPLLEQDVEHFTTRDVVCANTKNIKPEGTVQICYVFTGPVRKGLRKAYGAYYLVAAGTDVHEPVLNQPIYSYGCVGTAVAEHLCDLKIGLPPKAPTAPLPVGAQ